MLAGEEVKEEVKQASAASAVQEESKKKQLGLLDVAKVDWDYFSPENAQKARIQTLVSNADKAKQLRDQILKTHG